MQDSVSNYSVIAFACTCSRHVYVLEAFVRGGERIEKAVGKSCSFTARKTELGRGLAVNGWKMVPPRGPPSPAGATSENPYR